MAVLSNASPDEESSEYYISNQKFCLNLEKELVKLGFNQVNGKYNAWSYLVVAEKEDLFKLRKVIYKKSTYTSGNLLLSSKYQSLSEIIEWQIEHISNEPNFLIKQKIWTDCISIWCRKQNKLGNVKNYIISNLDKSSSIVDLIINRMNSLFITNCVYEVSYKNKILTIQLRSDKPHLNILKSILNGL